MTTSDGSNAPPISPTGANGASAAGEEPEPESAANLGVPFLGADGKKIVLMEGALLKGTARGATYQKRWCWLTKAEDPGGSGVRGGTALEYTKDVKNRDKLNAKRTVVDLAGASVVAVDAERKFAFRVCWSQQSLSAKEIGAVDHPTRDYTFRAAGGHKHTRYSSLSLYHTFFRSLAQPPPAVPDAEEFASWTSAIAGAIPTEVTVALFEHERFSEASGRWAGADGLLPDDPKQFTDARQEGRAPSAVKLPDAHWKWVHYWQIDHAEIDGVGVDEDGWQYAVHWPPLPKAPQETSALDGAIETIEVRASRLHFAVSLPLINYCVTQFCQLLMLFSPTCHHAS